MGTLDDFSVPVVTAHAFDELFVRAAIALGDEDVVGPTQVPRRLPQCATWQHLARPKRSILVNQHHIDRVCQIEILHAIVQN